MYFEQGVIRNNVKKVCGKNESKKCIMLNKRVKTYPTFHEQKPSKQLQTLTICKSHHCSLSFSSKISL